MKRNLGTLDRVIRYYYRCSADCCSRYRTNWLVGLAGHHPSGTALIGNCALYSLLGINTCRINKKYEGKT